PDGSLADARLDDLVQPLERPTAHEEDIGRVDLDKLLVGMLAPALGRDVGHGTLQDLEQGLLDALPRDGTGDRRVFGLPRALVVVVDRHREGLLGPVLPDDVLAQGIVDLAGLGGVARRRRGLALPVQLLFNDLGAQFDALVADVDTGAGYELSHLLLRFAAEG